MIVNVKETTFISQNGEAKRLGEYSKNVLLIVNVASYCGNTAQYEDLQKLHNLYSKKGLKILAFPCNDFGNQEPDSLSQIKDFCSTKFGVEFEIFTLHDKLSFFGFFPFYRYTYYISSSNVYILGENKLSKYYVRNSYQLKSSSHQWGGSFKFTIISNIGSKKGKSKSNTSGISIDIYRDMTFADLKIKGITTKVKSSNNGYSIKYSMPF